MTAAKFLILGAAAAVAFTASAARAQSHVHPAAAPGRPSSDSAAMDAMAGDAMGGHMDMNMMKHMALTPLRPATRSDSARAMQVAAELERAISRYRDTAAAVADGYAMFLPNVKTQKIFHFTNARHGFKEAFRFDPAQPTSLIYDRAADGTLRLLGAMYTMPKRTSLAKLDERIPLSIGRWHKHVNWCLPRLRELSRYAERDSDGQPKFGPESPVATKAACDAVGGRFYPSPLGWMIHVDVFAGHDLATIYGDTM